MKENWKIIKNYPEYAASNFGRIKRIKNSKHGGHKAEKILKSSWRGNYKKIGLSNNGKRKYISIHTLILETFIGKKPYGYEANHKNGIKTDNRVDNLEWVTPSENIKHAYKIGLKSIRGEKHPSAKLKNNEVWLIKKILASGVVSQGFIGKMFKVNSRTINNINTQKQWTHIQYP